VVLLRIPSLGRGAGFFQVFQIATLKLKRESVTIGFGTTAFESIRTG